MLSLPLKVGQPVLKKDAKPSFDICGVIDISGEVNGQVVVSMPEPLAIVLASELLGEAREMLDEDGIDAVGEIANMISGNAKTDFPGGTSAISVPRVVVGKDKLTYSAAAPIISIPCETEKGPLHIDVGLASAAR
jgi:chemotaxis protein CheX